MSETLEQLPQDPLAEATSPASSPLRELLQLALPTVLQMVSYTVMQFIDTWLLAHAMGPMAPTAASNAGGLSFAFIGFGIGLILVVNTLVSQNFGQKNFAHCGRHLWQGIWFALLFSMLILPLIPILSQAFVWFGHPPELIAMERVYVRFMLAAASLKLVQTALAQFMLGTNRPSWVTVSSCIGVAVNAVIAYVVVLGKFGVKPMGVPGAATAMVIGLFVEMVTLAYFAFRNPEDRRTFNALGWRLCWPEFRTLIVIGFGSGAQFFAEILAWSLFHSWVMGKLGPNEMAASSFMMRYLVVSFLPALGVSAAVTALVGRYIGMRRPDIAMHRAHLGFKVTLTYFALCAVIFILARRQLVEIFTTEPEVVRMGAILLVFAAFYQVFDGMYIVYCGALRGAGDTFIPAVVMAGLCWGVMVGGGYLIATTFPRFSVAGPWGVASLYGVTLGLFMLIRFQRGGWRTIHLEDGDDGIAPRRQECQDRQEENRELMPSEAH